MGTAFDAAALALAAGYGANNEYLYDNVNMPSVMVKIPKMTYAELGLGSSTATFPAFIVNGQEVDAIWISKFQNVVQNGRAYSLPGQDPQANVSFDAARQYCEAKGAGWHLMTRVEWALINLWCEQNAFVPKGNNNYGKHNTETVRKAIPTYYESNRIARVATGSGPLTWFHDNTPSGISDLCGNVWEWVGGIRTVYGEVQVLVNNNAADSSNPQTATSTAWMAIDATTGGFIAPNGSGTTANSVKMDWLGNVLTYSTTCTQSDTQRSCTFGAITCAATISDAAKLVLQSIGVLAKSASVLSASHSCYFNNGQAERTFNCGGTWNISSYGAASFDVTNARSSSVSPIGFRAAFVKLPTA